MSGAGPFSESDPISRDQSQATPDTGRLNPWATGPPLPVFHGQVNFRQAACHPSSTEVTGV